MRLGQRRGMMAEEMSSAALISEMARLDLQERRHLAAALRQVSQTFGEVPDGKTASHVLGVLARLLAAE